MAVAREGASWSSIRDHYHWIFDPGKPIISCIYVLVENFKKCTSKTNLARNQRWSDRNRIPQVFTAKAIKMLTPMELSGCTP